LLAIHRENVCTFSSASPLWARFRREVSTPHDPLRGGFPGCGNCLRAAETIVAAQEAENLSDIPKQSANVQWSRPGALVSTENKQQITLRLDAEVLSFFKNTGERYQSRINAVLREYVRAQRGTG